MALFHLKYAGEVSVSGTDVVINIPAADIPTELSSDLMLRVVCNIVAQDLATNEGAGWTTYATFKYNGAWTEVPTEADDHLQQDWVDPWSVDIASDGADGFNVNVTSDASTIEFGAWASVYIKATV